MTALRTPATPPSQALDVRGGEHIERETTSARALLAALDDAALDRLAERLADRLAPKVARLVAVADEPSHAVGLVDAAAAARELGVRRTYVYEHADRLGVVRIGQGRKPRLRFDLTVARAAIARDSGEESQAPQQQQSRRDSASVARARGRSSARRVPRAGFVLQPKGGAL